MDRYMMISSDCHAGPPWDVFRGYLDPQYREDYDRWVAAYVAAGTLTGGIKIDPHGKARREGFTGEEAVKSGGVNGAWDPEIRARELDREGVVAEVIFPDGQNRNNLPFGILGAQSAIDDGYSHEASLAAAKAHNRWLAEFCSAHPERHAGVAVILPHDVDEAVKEIEWAEKAGLYGGILLKGLSQLTNDTESFWHHPRYEPIWSACEELRLPVQTHVGGKTPNYGELPGTRWINSVEVFWITRRPVWFLIWGGVLERHPNLKVVVAEAGGSWVSDTFELLDHLYDVRNPEAARELLPLKPSEYWSRQCFIAASPPAGRSEILLRDRIGVGNIMWGSDYPHIEGTWPRSHERLTEMFAGVPRSEVRRIVGETAAEVYRFDAEKLRDIASRIGPAVSELGAPG